MNFEATLNRYQPYALAVLRIVTALCFMTHGTQKMFGFPASQGGGGGFELFSLMGLAAILEVFGGLAILLGLFTRPVAFVLAGQMAYAFWFVHVPLMGQGNIIPIANGGESAVLFCFIFLFLVFAGPGAWSVDGALKSRSRVTA
ncbi:DoxX family protein [Devosia sp. ZB163]|uniref:DoxX family protein n=1 Tax=Devosia sp. ZB163 TaxID=3025938 RepID=UPI002361CDBA|nr:DoxX family protein [Devosia sp. ZB163]MDC9824686.1 DoxX family protein [Devosia sp. ZB163]